jgi:cell shape-determining protein MreC
MARKRANRSRGTLFACGLVAGLIFLFFVPRGATGRLQLAYAHVFRWPLTLGRGVVLVSRTTPPARDISPRDYEKLLKAYQGVRNQSANLQAQLQETNKQLALLTKLQAKPALSHMQTIPAKVYMLAQDELTIGRGRDHGVAVGQYVLSLTEARLDNQCVIGVVSAVDAKGAQVKLFTDPTSRLPVRIGNLEVPMALEGRGDGTARIHLVPTTHAIQAGNVVYAQAKPGALDAPIVVAEVAQCQRDADNPHVWDITVRPVCNLAALTDVVVLKPLSAP